MEHIFKPGDKAYWIEAGWIELDENPDEEYPLVAKRFCMTFTADGRWVADKDIVLLPINPYDPADPNNPQEFRYPFMLNGRPVKIWDALYLLGFKETAKVVSLSIDGDRKFCKVTGFSPMEFSKENFCWPDELPKKKKVAKWAYPTIGVSGRLTVYFTEEITEEEARKVCGSSVQMIPDTEREVEG